MNIIDELKSNPNALDYAIPLSRLAKDRRPIVCVALVGIALGGIRHVLPPIQFFPIIYVIALLIIGFLWTKRAYQLSVLFLCCTLLTSIGLEAITTRDLDDPVQLIFLGGLFSGIFALLSFVGIAFRMEWDKWKRK